MENVFDLSAQYSHVKSHYGKAKVIESGDTLKLQSYSTIVAVFNKTTRELTINGTYSNTTMRHLKDFINQFTDNWVNNNDDIRELL